MIFELFDILSKHMGYHDIIYHILEIPQRRRADLGQPSVASDVDVRRPSRGGAEWGKMRTGARGIAT